MMKIHKLPTFKETEIVQGGNGVIPWTCIFLGEGDEIKPTLPMLNMVIPCDFAKKVYK